MTDTIRVPNLELVRLEAGVYTRDAMRLLFDGLNSESRDRHRRDLTIASVLRLKVKESNPGAQQDNFDLDGAGIVHLTGTVNRTFTGFRAPTDGKSQIAIVVNTGSATYTFAHASASSEAINRFRNQSVGDITLATDKAVIYLYLSSLWRELSLV